MTSDVRRNTDTRSQGSEWVAGRRRPVRPKPASVSKKPQIELISRDVSTQKVPFLSRVDRIFWVALGIWSTYNLVDAGLARVLALESLIHGTGPLGYIGINLYGADPNYEGSSMGSTAASGFIQEQASRKFFYVYKDTGFSEAVSLCMEHARFPFLCRISNLLYAREHAMWSGIGNFGCSKTLNAGKLASKLACKIAGMISGALTPNLKFRFTPEEILNCKNLCRFETDPHYAGGAFRTSTFIEPSRIGIIGSLLHGVNLGTFDRMYHHPGKVMVGAALLGAAALVAKATYNLMKSPLNVEEQGNFSGSDRLDSLRTVKKLAVGSSKVALAFTIIYLNTL